MLEVRIFERCASSQRRVAFPIPLESDLSSTYPTCTDEGQISVVSFVNALYIVRAAPKSGTKRCKDKELNDISHRTEVRSSAPPSR